MNLSTPNREKYHSYLKSYEWHQKKCEWIASGRPAFCFACEKAMPYVNAKGFNFHHRTYENLYNEKLDDLIPLCSEHHQELEIEFRVIRNHNVDLKTWTYVFISMVRFKKGLTAINKSKISIVMGDFNE
jgi:hypothetical protein